MIGTALEEWNLDELDLLLIENVGNLVCPSSYDLGEAMRVVLLSATEGEDKPLKYPTIFNTADITLLTKMDLAEAVEEGDQEKFADKLFQFDQMSKLDKWKTTLLLRVKEGIEEKGEDFS